MSDLVQLLTPEGVRVADDTYDPWVADVDADPAALRALYRDLVLVRRFDTEAVALQRQGELGQWASLLGQESAQVGAGRAMAPHDHAFPTYREHGVAWCRGVDPLQVLGLFRGVTLGGWDPREHGLHLYTIVIGSQALHATGYAMGVQRDGAVGTGDPQRDTAVLAFFGDGATSQGDVNEAFIWAGVTNAPVVFFCQNNQWAISEPLERQTRIPLYRRAHGFGFPGVRVDGNDVLACLAVTRAALARAREGSGPMLVEAFTYRMGAHTTSDDPTRYRVEAELEQWRLKDPVERVKAHLLRGGHADPEFLAQLDAEADVLAERVRTGCRRLPEPDPAAVFEDVYEALDPDLREQRDEIARLAALVDDEVPA
jgi:pyruvate dehydrogenase E1 component alpha subunit